MSLFKFIYNDLTMKKGPSLITLRVKGFYLSPLPPPSSSAFQKLIPYTTRT